MFASPYSQMRTHAAAVRTHTDLLELSHCLQASNRVQLQLLLQRRAAVIEHTLDSQRHLLMPSKCMSSVVLLLHVAHKHSAFISHQ
jgi:hypothetical protein